MGRKERQKKGALMKKAMTCFLAFAAAFGLNVCAAEASTLVYGSGDYTRINPAMDEHGEINILIFNGLTGHVGDNQVVPGLAKDPAFAFICYIDANYVAKASIQGIAPDTIMGHHGVGIFWNVADWTIEE